MSDVRVNLLPEDVRKRGEAGRRNGLVAVGFVVLLAVIGAVYFLQVQRVNSAQDDLDAEQATLQALQADLADLQEFETLRTLQQQGHDVLRLALSGEASVAGILQDIAAVMPTDAQLDNLVVTVTGESDQQLGDTRAAWGTLVLTGQTRLGHAPGLERLLLEFDKIAAFSDLYFSDSTIDERGVSTFNAQADLGPEVLTGRYVDGLPEELR